MPEPRPRVGQQRPGGRAARVRAAVLAATSDLLMEVGYDAVSVDEVARRAGVHKTTVYRRWPTKPELVFDAVGVQTEVDVPLPDTGSLAGDLRALARAVVANIGSVGGGRRSRSIVAAAASSEELASAVHDFMRRRMAANESIVTRAIERDELPKDADANLVIEVLAGAIWLRLLLTGETIDEEFADRVAALVSAGATG